jgi:uncharacterized OB-fold protein
VSSDDVVVPVPDELTAPFWTAAREHRLELQRCTSCARINHPPQVLCGWCSSDRLAYAGVDGRGHVVSYTSALRRARGGPVPEHTVVVVELDEQPGVLLVCGVPGPRPAWVRIGEPVQPWFMSIEGVDIVLPQFRPLDTEG